MKFSFARLLCTIGIFACLFIARAGAQPYRLLTADDFLGTPLLRANVIAYTNCSIDYRYEARREQNYYMLNFTILLTVNSQRSWMDKNRVTTPQMLAEILKHEQGHYDITYLEQQELLQTVSRTVFYGNYQQAAREIFDRIDARYKQLNRDYDEDTQHMANRERQQAWDTYFKMRLDPEYLAGN